MNKIGIYKIGFKEQNEVSDEWVQEDQQQEQQEEMDRTIPNPMIVGNHWFKSIDQDNTTLTEELVMDESGKRYEVELPFVVRKTEDIALAKKYEGRPVVVYAFAVDGKRYTIGSKEYPARLVTSNRYQALDTREMAMTVSYKSNSSLMR